MPRNRASLPGVAAFSFRSAFPLVREAAAPPNRLGRVAPGIPSPDLAGQTVVGDVPALSGRGSGTAGIESWERAWPCSDWGGFVGGSE